MRAPLVALMCATVLASATATLDSGDVKSTPMVLFKRRLSLIVPPNVYRGSRWLRRKWRMRWHQRDRKGHQPMVRLNPIFSPGLLEWVHCVLRWTHSIAQWGKIWNFAVYCELL